MWICLKKIFIVLILFCQFGCSFLSNKNENKILIPSGTHFIDVKVPLIEKFKETFKTNKDLKFNSFLDKKKLSSIKNAQKQALIKSFIQKIMVNIETIFVFLYFVP